MAAGVARSEAVRAAKVAKAAVAQPAARGSAVSRISVAVVRLILSLSQRKSLFNPSEQVPMDEDYDSYDHEVGSRCRLCVRADACVCEQNFENELPRIPKKKTSQSLRLLVVFAQPDRVYCRAQRTEGFEGGQTERSQYVLCTHPCFHSSLVLQRSLPLLPRRRLRPPALLCRGRGPRRRPQPWRLARAPRRWTPMRTVSVALLRSSCCCCSMLSVPCGLRCRR